MKTELFAVYDNKAQAFANPFTMQNRAMAIRAFKYAVNDKTTEPGKFPEDYSLFILGTFNDADASIELIQQTCIAYGLAMVEREETPQQNEEYADVV